MEIKITANRIILAVVMVFSLMGIWSSLVLSVDKYEYLENQGLELNCDINAVVKCSTVMETDQAEVLGFPNTLLGIAGYSAVLTIAVMAFIQDFKFKRFWQIFALGTFGAFLFSYWLLYESIFTINSLCPYCLLSCFSMTIIFFSTMLFLLKNNYIPYITVDWNKDKKNLIAGILAAIIVWITIWFGIAYSVFGESLWA